MSSLSATQADGYYIPPSYIESGAYKKQSINQYAKSKGHNQYLQRSVVRFELPYDGFCTKCNGHVGKGTRFNAHKKDGGFYLSSKIHEFEMKCRLCAECHFVIRTNPKGRCFDYVKGIKKKVEEFDTVEAGTLGVIDTELGNGIISSSDAAAAALADVGEGKDGQYYDPLSKLQSSAMGERKVMTERDQMEALLKLQNTTMYKDADANANLRSKFRVSRKAKKRRLVNASNAGLGYGIEVDDDDDDNIYKVEETREARKALYGNKIVLDQRARKREKESFLKVRSGSIFSKVEGKSDEKKRRNKMLHCGSSSSGGDARRKSAVVLSKNSKTLPADQKLTALTAIRKSECSTTKEEEDTSAVTTTRTNEASPSTSSTEATNVTSSLSALVDYSSDSD
mmetsp:Transcript_7484/g.11132  ORF Transcript_7484/g.11132 Transcript_7484/m.11132 type:complete len:396 (-) Transcript_7484:158-1345(-)